MLTSLEQDFLIFGDLFKVSLSSDLTLLGSLELFCGSSPTYRGNRRVGR